MLRACDPAPGLSLLEHSQRAGSYLLLGFPSNLKITTYYLFLFPFSTENKVGLAQTRLRHVTAFCHIQSVLAGPRQ